VTAGLTALVITATSVGLLLRAFDGRDTDVAQPLPSVSAHEVVTIPVGRRGQLNAITAAFGSVWVAAYGVPDGAGQDQGAILRIDPSSNQVTDMVPTEVFPTWETGGGGLTSGDGSLWVVGSATIDADPQGVLERIDPSSMTVVSQIPLGGDIGAGDVAISTSGVWVTAVRDDSAFLLRVDPESERVTDRIALEGRSARRVVATDDAVIVQELEWDNQGGPCALLASIDPTDGQLLAEEPANGCTGDIFNWEGEVWGTTDVGFTAIDPATALPTGPVTPFVDQGFPRGDPVVDPTGVWFGAYPGGNGSAPDILSRLDPAAGRVETYPIEIGWSAAAPLNGSLWAMNWEGSVSRIVLSG
jgi:streptogramin lyase